MYAGLLNNTNPSVLASEANRQDPRRLNQKKGKKKSTALEQLGAGAADLGSGIAYAAEDLAGALNANRVAKEIGEGGDYLREYSQGVGEPQGVLQNIVRELPETAVSFVPYVGTPLAAASAYGNSLEGQRQDGSDSPNRLQAAGSGALNFIANKVKVKSAKADLENAKFLRKKYKAIKAQDPTKSIATSKSGMRSIDNFTKGVSKTGGLTVLSEGADNYQKDLLKKNYKRNK